ncbi:2-hydroxyisoflavanone dehydratase-like [Arachis stenosperma]|uniref:2-hydroxyisoflavanone dehydratase-like n=1 Tax=Arachis stenosperma TaxID=217475 RepID=UPI0025AD4DBF|nr:2-hydroxyisoflavanone dehydratase-like [Arachis stenosperma]
MLLSKGIFLRFIKYAPLATFVCYKPTLPPPTLLPKNQTLIFSAHTQHTKMVTTAPQEKEVTHEFPFFRVFKDGTVEVLRPPPKFLPPSDDPATGLRIKDTVISSDPPVSARLFLPKITNNNKLPVYLFFHGSGFCARSAFSPEYSNHVAAVANEAKVLAVSVEYGKFPARPLPACYEDAWRSFQWVTSHADGTGTEPWLNDHGDFQRLFVAGSSAGGNITHTLVSQIGKTGSPPGVRVEGAIMVHPFFGGIGDDAQWLFMCKDNKGPEDPRLKPAEEDLRRLGCERVLVCVAEKDSLMVAGKNYVEALKKSGWGGSIELVIHWGMTHSQHVHFPDQGKSREVLRKFASFIHQQP